MARKRGFFAELQYQGQLAQKRKLQDANAAARTHAAAVRNAEQARMHAERAHAQLARATLAEQKSAEREAQRLHDEAMQAEAEERNARLAATKDEIDSIFRSALDVDVYVDLERLRTVAEHPPFGRSDLEVPTPAPVPLSVGEEPRYLEPVAPKGLFGRKKHAEAIATAQAEFAKQHAAWEAQIADLPAAQLCQMEDYERAEKQRLGWVDQVRREYQADCDQREAAVAQANAALDELIRGVSAGASEAIQEYVGIVLGNSVYPEAFTVEHDFVFDSDLKELSLVAIVPPPSSLPPEKEFKYVRSKGEIVSSVLSQKEQKERYADAICQVAVRSLHEVFAADRAEHIQTIALTVCTESIDAGTGLPKRTALVAVSADRSAFLTFDLTKVVPAATLRHLNALISKSPFDLVAIDGSKGVRGV